MLNRRVVVGVTGAVALIGPSLSTAVAASHVARKHSISETQHIAMVATRGKLGTPSFRLISAGIFDGKIGPNSISGALRASSQLTTSGNSIVRGTEFEAGGSRTFVIHNSLPHRPRNRDRPRSWQMDRWQRNLRSRSWHVHDWRQP